MEVPETQCLQHCSGATHAEVCMDSLSLKTCTKCGVEQPFENYSKNKLGRNGLNPHCRKCDAAKGKAWQQANKEKVAARKKLWGEKNRASLNAAHKRWCEKYPDRVVAFLSTTSLPLTLRAGSFDRYARGAPA